MPEKFYVTTPIYYVNARPHIGHAYTTLAADTIARRHRLLGDDTFFLTGTDEHGQKIERSAAAAGIPPQQFADEVSASFSSLWQRMGITHNAFIRTTSDAHKRGAQKLFADLYANGQIYLSSYTGQYSIGEEMFVDGPPGTIGPDGQPTETVTEENFFFRLSDYQEQLTHLIESGELKIQPEARKNEVLSFVKSGLRDLSVSRSSFTWGIPVPEPAASETKQKHVIYVWLDALANYMTAIGYGSDEPADQKKFDKYWPADLHLVGKEIIRFHCVYWPAFLLAAGLPLPKAVTAHGWLLFDDSKMSKSKGNIVRAETILDAFGEHVYKKEFPDSTKEEQDLFATDVLRYFLLREIPFGQDGSFSFDALITRYNAELANGYGNLVSRTLKMIHNSFDSIIPPSTEKEFDLDDFKNWAHPGVDDEEARKRADEAELQIPDMESKYERDHHSLEWGLRSAAYNVSSVNRYISEQQPWKLAKQDSKEGREKLGNILFSAISSIEEITVQLYPFLPNSTANVWQQLGLGDIQQASLTRGRLQPGTKLGASAHIFPSIKKDYIPEFTKIMIDMEAAKATPSPLAQEKAEPHDTNHPAAGPRTAAFTEPNPGTTVAGSHALTTERPLPPTINEQPTTSNPAIAIDDFLKVDLRVAQILVAERIPKADKLLRLEVDLGPDMPRRQILSGIAEWYTPEELLGRRIVIVANLAPRKMRGLESHGMLLAASAGEHTRPILTTFPDTETLPLGSRVR